MRRSAKIHYMVTKVLPIFSWKKCCICGEECKLEIMYSFRDVNNTMAYICRECKPKIKDAHSYVIRRLSRPPMKKMPEAELVTKFKKALDEKRNQHVKRKK